VTANGYTSVIPARLEPGKGAMALIAGFDRLVSAAVTGRFAHALPAVVAGCALPRQCGAMVEASPKESGSVEVASITRCIGHYVSSWHWRCHNTLTQRMTTVASLRCAFEYTGNVTSFASRRSVPAGKWKTGSCVIKVAPGQLRFGHRLQRIHSQHHGKHVADNSSQSLHDSSPLIDFSRQTHCFYFFLRVVTTPIFICFQSLPS
jgi:hypothetical protein